MRFLYRLEMTIKLNSNYMLKKIRTILEGTEKVLLEV